MDDLTLLLTDHSLLKENVTQLVGLVRSARMGEATSAWHRESLRAAESLRKQLVDHCEFEGLRLFPALVEVESARFLQIEQFMSEHERILGLLDDFRAQLLLAAPGQLNDNLWLSALLLESRLIEHADSETRFLTQCADSKFAFAV